MGRPGELSDSATEEVVGVGETSMQTIGSIAYPFLRSGDYVEKTPSPEKNMLIAMLERAALDLGDVDRLKRRGALNWICNKQRDENDPFSFLWVMTQLELGTHVISEYRRRAVRQIQAAEWFLRNRARDYAEYRKRVARVHQAHDLFDLFRVTNESGEPRDGVAVR